jgi:hypothetical protein
LRTALHAQAGGDAEAAGDERCEHSDANGEQARGQHAQTEEDRERPGDVEQPHGRC